ncbi:MAG: hypothetical protein AUK47_28365 [Deltaproteobacteria bacterium CG2_30_63_29]|nr:MAG: hypothetical protein AUK47_28365 [Deltaproteobacteria bacterium CG2_30_63_29]PJB39878.1 MAG: hypothetical protein CO108_16175 [Deltaproteobacteria bacterium CG_4_9_14_3_um_filter_63_12]
MASSVNEDTAPAQKAEDAEELETRDVLESAYFLLRRNLMLAMWDLLGGMASSILTNGAVIIAVVALVLPALVNLGDSPLGVLDAVFSTFERLSSTDFLLPASGLLFAALLLGFATTAFVRAGIYGRLQHSLSSDPKKGTSGFWSAARAHFPTLIGYGGVQLLLDAALTVFASVTVLWPCVLAFEASARTGDVSWLTVLFIAMGAAATAVLGALLYLWQMVALYPLLEGRSGLWQTLGDAAHHLGGHLFSYIKLLLGLAIVSSPAFLTYLAFWLVTSIMLVAPDLAMFAMLARMGFDLVFALALSALGVYAAAAFMIQYLLNAGLIQSLPKAPSKQAHPPRVALRLGSRLELPGIPGAGLIIMPLPQRFPNLQNIGELFPNLERPLHAAPSPAPAESTDDTDDADPPAEPLSEAPVADAQDPGRETTDREPLDAFSALDPVSRDTGSDAALEPATPATPAAAGVADPGGAEDRETPRGESLDLGWELNTGELGAVEPNDEDEPDGDGH